MSDKMNVVVGHIKSRVVKAKNTIKNMFVSDEDPPSKRGIYVINYFTSINIISDKF